MSATERINAPLSALAARKARAIAAAAKAESADLDSSSSSRKQAALVNAGHYIGTVNAEASSSAANRTRSRKASNTVLPDGRSSSRSPEPAKQVISDSESGPSVYDDSDVRARARKRAKAARASNHGSASQSIKAAEPHTKRGKAPSRYFSDGSREASSDQKAHRGAISPTPIEDVSTGFVSFGDEETFRNISEDEGMSSDESSEHETAEADNTRRIRQDQRDPSPVLLARSQSASVSSPMSFIKPAGPTIPYSNYTVEIGRNCVVHALSPKQVNADSYTFGMLPGETLTFVGIGNVEVLKGKLQIGGAILAAIGSKTGTSSARVFAPTYHPLPLLKALDSTQDGFSPRGYPNTFAAATFSTIVRISPFESSIVEMLQVCAVGGGASPPFTAPTNLPLLKIPQLSTLKMLFEPDAASLTGQQQYFLQNNIAILAGLSATYTPHAWQSALHHLATSVRSAAIDPQDEAVVALIRGPKKVGKSTFSRMVLERILTMGQDMGGKVAFLELDLGQSDFGPPGMVSLHVLDSVDPFTIGPGWVQPRVPLKAHFIGDLSPKDDPASYMDAIVDLVTFFRDKVLANSSANGATKKIPLVINTQGWVKGLGADLALRIESLLCPTHIYEIVPRGSVAPVPNPIRGSAWLDAEGAIVAAGAEIVTLESVNQSGYIPGVLISKPIENHPFSSVTAGPGDGGPVPPPYVTDTPSRLTPADMRILNTMTYLYAKDLGSSPDNVGWNFSRPLVHARPLMINVESGLKAGIRILSFGSSLPDAFKPGALNACIVAIIACTGAPEVTSVEDTDDVARIKAVWKAALRSGSELLVPGPHTQCLGLGIVRSVDVRRSEVHLLTPLSAEFLAAFPALGLIKGALDLPIWASLDFDAIKDVKESKLNVAPLTFRPLVSAPQPGLAGIPRNRVPYVEWPWIPPPRTLSSAQGLANSSINTKNPQNPARHQQSTLATLGSQKRKVRRNLMRRGQFV